MSYHIVQKIEIDEEAKRVYITGSDNNVWPRTPHRWESTYFQRDEFQNTPNFKEAVELDLMRAYDEGNFQAGRQNKFTRALKVLRKMPEYQDFDWRADWDRYKANKEDIERYNALLKKALTTRLPKDKYIITKVITSWMNGEPTKVYFNHRKRSHHCKWYYEAKKATKFDYKEDAEATPKYFTNSEGWTIEKLTT